ncbi:hypothetical protein VYU27_000394 [Nannochloropsis oceanica]
MATAVRFLDVMLVIVVMAVVDLAQGSAEEEEKEKEEDSRGKLGLSPHCSPSMKTFETTSTPAMEPWKGHTSMSPAQQLHHHRVLTCLLFDPALERREREVATDKAVTVTAQQARRDRLLLVEALKEQHKQQLAEEVAMMNKRVEETQAWVRREIENLRPVALAVVVKEYEKAMEYVQQQQQNGRGGGEREGGRRGGRFRLEEEEDGDEMEYESGMYVGDRQEEMHVNLLGGAGGVGGGMEGGLSPPSPLLTKKRASPMTNSGGEQPQRSKKKRKGQKQQQQQQQQLMGRGRRSMEEELIAMMMDRGGIEGKGGEGGGGRGRVEEGEGFDRDGMAQEVMSSLNQVLLQKQLTAALAASTREYERERQHALNEEIEKRVKQAVGQIEREMKSEFECILEEEKEKVRILTEVAADQARKEMEENLREEHKEEIQALMQKVGLA